MEIGAIKEIDKGRVYSQEFSGQDAKTLLTDMMHFCGEKDYSVSAINLDPKAFWSMFVWPEGFLPYAPLAGVAGYFVLNGVKWELWVRKLDDTDISIRAYDKNLLKHWLNGKIITA